MAKRNFGTASIVSVIDAILEKVVDSGHTKPFRDRLLRLQSSIFIELPEQRCELLCRIGRIINNEVAGREEDDLESYWQPIRKIMWECFTGLEEAEKSGCYRPSEEDAEPELVLSRKTQGNGVVSLATAASLKTDQRMRNTQFLIEASSAERLHIWEKWCQESKECRREPEGKRFVEGTSKKWEQQGGISCTVGELDNRPICVSLTWDVWDGYWVCWWEATSVVRDYDMIEKWLKSIYSKETKDRRPATCDVMNIHHCLHDFVDWKKAYGIS